jgi:hypothetical protein
MRRIFTILRDNRIVRSLTDVRPYRAHVATLCRWAAQRPLLRRSAIRLIALHPGIESRLRRLMTVPAVPETVRVGFEPSSAAAFGAASLPDIADVDASAAERRVLIALHRAAAKG